MEIIRCLLLISVLLAGVCATVQIPPENRSTTETPITSTPVTTPTPVTKKTTVTTPTTKPTTSTTKPTTSTTKPTTPTTKPTTPTTKPTDPTTSTTTKPAPITTTTAKPPVDPQPGQWNVTYPKTNTSCIVVKMAVQMQYPYKMKDNKIELISINVPVNATASGNCTDKEVQMLNLDWKSIEGNKNNLTFRFSKTKENKFDLYSIETNMFIKIENKSVNLVHRKNDFPTTVDRSYKCDKVQTLNLTASADKKEVTLGYLLVSHVQLQAFHNVTDKSFAQAEDCEPINTTDVVPIAVGCALAALIVIVLIAYLIGRRRSQARGYLSM